MHDRRRPRSKDPDIQGSYDALLRAAKRAREIARATGTPLVLWRDGRVVHEYVGIEDNAAATPKEEPQ